MDAQTLQNGHAGYGAYSARLEEILGNPELVELGRKVVEEQVYCFSGFSPTRLDLLSDWTANPFNDRSWQWQTASLNFIPWLIAYYGTSAPAAEPRFAIEAVRSWCAATQAGLRDYEFAMHDHAIAVRTENLLLLAAYLASRGLCGDARLELEALVDGLCGLLEDDAFYSRHTNHGIEQSRILATAAYVLDGHQASARRWDTAMARLANELAFAFTREGVNVENSPGYHDYVCNAFLKVVRAFPRDRMQTLRRSIDALMPKAMRFLTHIVRPDGKLPIIGDTQLRGVHSRFDAYAGRPEAAWLEYATSSGRRGQPPEETVAAFPGSGYLVVRDRWRKAGDAGKDVHLVMKCGYRSRYHRHDDDFNIVLFFGEDWLVDGGAYSYEEASPVRRYLRSKWSHNVPVIQHPGRGWRALSPRSYGAALQVDAADDGSVAALARTGAYAGYRASRSLEVSRSRRSFTVHDRLDPIVPRGESLFRSLWHFPDDKQIYRRNQDFLVLSTKSGRALRIRNVGERFGSVGEFLPEIAGQAGAVMSPRANQLAKVRVVSLNRRASSFESRLRFDILDHADTRGWRLL